MSVLCFLKYLVEMDCLLIKGSLLELVLFLLCLLLINLLLDPLLLLLLLQLLSLILHFRKVKYIHEITYKGPLRRSNACLRCLAEL